MARAHELSFVELQTFEELGTSVHQSAWLLFQGHGHDLGQAAHTAQGRAATFSRGRKRDPATIQGLSMATSIFPPWERFEIRLKIPRTVLPFPSHKFTTSRTPARMSGDKKGQSYFLIWSSLLYSPSALVGRSGFIPRERPWEGCEQLSKHSVAS